MTKQELEKKISEYYKKWSDSGLNEYEKIALKHLEAKYKLIATK
jgi:hypothetical protein